MMDDYEKEIEKQKRIVKKYQSLPLKDFLKKTLVESGYDPKRINNVYIDEIVTVPNAWGCYKQNGIFVTYATNYRGEALTYTYNDAYLFFRAFLKNSSFFSKNNETNNTPQCQNTTNRTDYFDEMWHYKQINQHNTFEGKNSNASKFSESIFWRFIGILCLIFFLLLTFSASPIFIIGVVAVILAWYFIHKKKRHSNNKDK